MKITVKQMLNKIEKELEEARESSDPGRIRERVHAIKSICELILDTNAKEADFLPNASVSPDERGIFHSVNQHSERLEIEDKANGDSIFEF